MARVEICYKKVFYYLGGLAGMQTTVTNPDWGGGRNPRVISNWAFYDEGGTSVLDTGSTLALLGLGLLGFL